MLGHIGKSKNVGQDARKYIKRATSKKRRRMAKRYHDDAPKIVTKGWAD